MANLTLKPNTESRLKTTATTFPGTTPNGENKTPGTGGVETASKGSLGKAIGGALGYRNGKQNESWPMPKPGVHDMTSHTKGVTSAHAHSAFAPSKRFGKYSGSDGPTAPRGGVPRHKGGLVGAPGVGGIKGADGSKALSSIGRSVPGIPPKTGTALPKGFYPFK